MNCRVRWFAATAFAVALLLSVASQSSAQNVALGRPMINGSGSWNSGNFNTGSFPASRAVDGVTNEAEGTPESYWLGREATFPEFFTLDLGAMRNLDQIKLYNTHNRQFNDRSTDEFVLYAGTMVDGSNNITDEIPILAGNLSNVSGQAAITPNVFTAGAEYSAGLQARYLRFEALSSHVGSSASVGLNEIEVIDMSFLNPNIAAGKPIIAGSGSWAGGTPGVGETFNNGSFPAHNVVDEAIADAGGNIWLGREGVPTETFTMDLLNVRNIAEITLRNTHNGGSNDRGTKRFRVLASDAVDGSNELVNPQVILTGQLPNIAGMDPAPGLTFTAANGLASGTARYLKFEAESSYYDINSVGLNEMEVYSTAIHAPSALIRQGNLAAGKPVINGSGAWDGGGQCVGQPFNGGTFPAGRVTDESIADANSGRTSYWLGRENCADEFFTVDLGELTNVNEVVLQNSHNTQFNDRGTGEFAIYGSATVDGSNNLVNPVLIIAGELTNASGTIVIPEDHFLVDPSAPPVRYLEFHALTYLSSATNGGAGLNEFEVYGTVVPEPSTWSLAVIGSALVGWTWRRRRSR